MRYTLRRFRAFYADFSLADHESSLEIAEIWKSGLNALFGIQRIPQESPEAARFGRVNLPAS